MINGSSLAPVDILGALTSRPATPDPAGILDGVRDVETSRSKAALIGAATAQAREASGEIAALASLCDLVVTSDLPEARKGVLLDGTAQLVRSVATSGSDRSACRRALVLGLGDLLRSAGADAPAMPGSTMLAAHLRAALTAAARTGTIVGCFEGIPDAA